MKFNRTIFWRVFTLLTILETCFMLTGCTAAWLGAISALLPTIGAVVNAIVAFVAALSGKTVSASTTAAIQKWAANVSTEISNAETLIAAAKQSAGTSILGEIQAVMESILSQFNSILSGVDVTDSSTIAKLTQFVALGVAAINAVLSLIPMAMEKIDAGASEDELKQYDKLGANAVKNATKTMRETYAAILSEHTPSADVNAALDSLPKSI
jgi:hypothetical protein